MRLEPALSRSLAISTSFFCYSSYKMLRMKCVRVMGMRACVRACVWHRPTMMMIKTCHNHICYEDLVQDNVPAHGFLALQMSSVLKSGRWLFIIFVIIDKERPKHTQSEIVIWILFFALKFLVSSFLNIVVSWRNHIRAICISLNCSRIDRKF